MALAIDPSTPAVAVQTNNTTATVTSASFTPPNGALVLVGWAWNTLGGGSPTQPTITNSGTPLTYSLIGWRARPEGATDGQAAMWWAVSSGAAMTVTATAVNAGLQAGALYCWVLTGQKLSGSPVGAFGEGTAASATTSIAQNYTAQGTNSRSFIAVSDWALAGAKTAGTGATVSASGNAGSEISYGFLRRTNADGVNGVTNTLNVTTPSSNALQWVYAEILEEPAASAGDLWSPIPIAPFQGMPFDVGAPPPWEGIPYVAPAVLSALPSTLAPVGVVSYGAGTKRGSVASTAVSALSTHGTAIHVARPATVTSVAAFSTSTARKVQSLATATTVAVASTAVARKVRSLATVSPVTAFGRGSSTKVARSLTTASVTAQGFSVALKVTSLATVSPLALASRGSVNNAPIVFTGTVATIGAYSMGTARTVRSRSTATTVAAFSRGVSRTIRSRTTATTLAAFSRGTGTHRALAGTVAPVVLAPRGTSSGRHNAATRTPVLVLSLGATVGRHNASTVAPVCLAAYGSVLREEQGRIGVLRGDTANAGRIGNGGRVLGGLSGAVRAGSVTVTTETVGEIHEL